MRASRTTMIAGVVVALSACGAGQRAQEPAAVAAQPQQREAQAQTPQVPPPMPMGKGRGGGMGGMGMCPMNMPNTTVRATETPEGAALTFTTDEAHLDELRSQVRHMAQMRESMSQRGGGRGRGGPPHVAVDTETKDVQGGIQMLLEPVDPEQVDAVRAETRWRAERMQTGTCPAMDQGA